MDVFLLPVFYSRHDYFAYIYVYYLFCKVRRKISKSNASQANVSHLALSEEKNISNSLFYKIQEDPSAVTVGTLIFPSAGPECCCITAKGPSPSGVQVLVASFVIVFFLYHCKFKCPVYLGSLGYFSLALT